MYLFALKQTNRELRYEHMVLGSLIMFIQYICDTVLKKMK